MLRGERLMKQSSTETITLDLLESYNHRSLVQQWQPVTDERL